jgi:sodium transport system permease protein
MNKTFIILKKELKETFRDKKSLRMMLVMPIIIPIFIILMSSLFVSESREQVEDFNKVGFNYEFTEKEKELAKNSFIEPVYEDETKLKEMFDNGELNLYVLRDGNKYGMYYRNNETSGMTLQLAEEYFQFYKEELQKEYLEKNGINSKEVLEIITFEDHEEKSENFIGKYMGEFSFIYIIMAITIAATYPATDATAGEKERGTLETLFTFPVKSRDIIVGKYLGVTAISLITGLLSLFLAEGALIYVNNKYEMLHAYNIVFSVPTLLILLLMIILFSFLVSGLTIAMASRSKTFKEAQSALAPINMIVMLPGLISYFMNLKTTPLYSMIPFLNMNLIFSDTVKGEFNIVNIGLMILSTIIFITLLLSFIIKQYKSEETLFG